jgi:hypothetical protein
MPQKKQIPFIQTDSGELPGILYRSRFVIVVLVSILLLLISCSKATEIQQQAQQAQLTLAQQYFQDNILNRDFRVKLATDSGVDVSAQYNGYLFRLTKNTLLDGPMTGSNGISNYTGTWSCNDDYSKLTISFTSPPPQFSFINREWKFTKKAVPVMELAPWGTTDPKVLHMERQ